MHPKISLLINSRIEGNANWGLKNLLKDLAYKSADINNFEVLIKFDDDDVAVVELDPTLNCKITAIRTPRRRGYADLHCGYADLMPLVSESSIMVGAIADDMRVIHQGWDELLLKTARNCRELFIIHSHKPNENVNIDNLEGTVHDESPFWSKKLIHICQCNWWIYATDAWTTALEYWLEKYGCNFTVLTHLGLFRRNFNGAIDTQQNTERWNVRSKMFEFTRGSFFKKMVRLQALNIVNYSTTMIKNLDIGKSSCQSSSV